LGCVNQYAKYLQGDNRLLCVLTCIACWADGYFSADRTNSRAYGTILCLSVVCLSVTYVLWLSGTS